MELPCWPRFWLSFQNCKIKKQWPGQRLLDLHLCKEVWSITWNINHHCAWQQLHVRSSANGIIGYEVWDQCGLILAWCHVRKRMPELQKHKWQRKFSCMLEKTTLFQARPFSWLLALEYSIYFKKNTGLLFFFNKNLHFCKGTSPSGNYQLSKISVNRLSHARQHKQEVVQDLCRCSAQFTTFSSVVLLCQNILVECNS